MAEQLKLFEDILPLNGTKEKRDLTEKRMLEKKEKPYYVTNLATGKLEDVNNPKDDLYPKDKKIWKVGLRKRQNLTNNNRPLKYRRCMRSKIPKHRS